MATLKFTVDSHLLRELGERLVGKPYIALAELIKNSYDADANKVTIVLDPSSNRIEVNDDGHGMNFEEFKQFWMRIGSTHKDDQVLSRRFKRRMTGSKGVGRLAVQYLADRMEMTTISTKDPTVQLTAKVQWEDAVETGDLTQATVEYETVESTERFRNGTSIILSGLRQKWNKSQIEGLTKEIWFLTPPFRTQQGIPGKKRFEVALDTPIKEFRDVFDTGMKDILDIWHARIVGKAIKGKVEMILEYADEDAERCSYEEPDCELDFCEFEIRIYHLKYRQPRGIPVELAREYVNEWGGVHVYDREFHLPYYGQPANDWLGIEMDHSHRRTESKFLPKDLQVPGGLSFLPTNSRILGVAKVDTRNNEKLSISITRDRLQDSKAFEDLKRILRWSIDTFAMREAARSSRGKKSKRKTEKPIDQLSRLRSSLSDLKEYVPEELMGTVEDELAIAVKSVQEEGSSVAAKLGVLASFASAGVATIAYRHELGQQFASLERFIRNVKEMKFRDKAMKLQVDELARDLDAWLTRARATNALFEHLGTPENIKDKKRLNAYRTVGEIMSWLEPMSRGIPIVTDGLDKELLLPSASIAGWGSIFQNVVFNAFNALIESDEKKIDISSRVANGRVEVLIQDTGIGINLDDSKRLFEPFERGLEISEERRKLGYGGNGLGLTVVKVIAEGIGCDVRFVEPEPGFKTAFCISWEESS